MGTGQVLMSTQATSHALHGAPAGEREEQPSWADLAQRLQKAERQSRWLKYALIIMAPLLVYVFASQELPKQLVQKEPLVAADRLQLLDEQGNIRMYMPVYYGVPRERGAASGRLARGIPATPTQGDGLLPHRPGGGGSARCARSGTRHPAQMGGPGQVGMI